ncbi:S8 family peptidase [Solirubrobacter soli]|uniref:S8 family peptidase n=1 Tax=Solirubrobacter soli TaxID=363832 RepID=UPI000411B351|nr:S8 family serine peptidase [Solirubrobacter soli]
MNIRTLLGLAVTAAVAGLAATASVSMASVNLPRDWDPATVAVNRDPANTFLLRPGQIVAGPGDAQDVQRLLPDWRQDDQHPFGLTLFTRTPQNPADPAKEILAALARVRKGTAGRPQGSARVAPNYVFVGESVGGAADAINFSGEPRVQGGPGSTARVAKLPAALPLRTTQAGDGQGVKIAVLDTGMFDHAWLTSVQRAPNSTDVWDADHDGYGDAESGHGTFIAGLIRQVAPATSVYEVKVLDSHGIGDDFTVAKAMGQLPADTDIINLSLGGYTDKDAPPLAIAQAMQAFGKSRVVVAAAGNDNSSRPFWPAAFEPVLAVGADEVDAGKWTRADYSNYGPWVDAVARGSNLQSTFARAKTKLALGELPDPLDPIIAFNGWASWDGTSFATPIAAALIARTMTRVGIGSPLTGEAKLLAGAPAGTQADSPNAVLLDELEGLSDPNDA